MYDDDDLALLFASDLPGVQQQPHLCGRDAKQSQIIMKRRLQSSPPDHKKRNENGDASLPIGGGKQTATSFSVSTLMLFLVSTMIPFYLVYTYTTPFSWYQLQSSFNVTHNQTFDSIQETAVSNNVHEKDGTLDCVIHVGLFKTGTTTIQGALGTTLSSSLELDNYYYLGQTGGKKAMVLAETRRAISRDSFMDFAKAHKCLFPTAEHVAKHGECTLDSPASQEFLQQLSQHHAKGHHITMSWEGISLLSTQRIQLLKDILQHAGYSNPRIVISSRYYHEWAHSWIQQYFRPQTYNRHMHQFGPQGATIPTLCEFLAKDPIPYHNFCTFDTCYFDWLDHSSHAPATLVRDRFSQLGFSNIQIFPFNQDNGHDLVTNFVCQTFQAATQTCQYLHNMKEPPPRLKEHKPRLQLDYEYLVQTAYQNYNLTVYNTQRQTLSLAVRRHHRKFLSGCGLIGVEMPCSTLRPLGPLICLTDHEKELLIHKVVSFERELFPRHFEKKEFEVSLRQTVKQDLQDDKYCWLGTQETLVQPEWDQLFTKLVERAKQLGKAKQVRSTMLQNKSKRYAAGMNGNRIRYGSHPLQTEPRLP